MENTLYGTCSENCVAYCRRHCAHLTVKQMRGKNCLGKQCWYLEKIESHEWWQQRERTKQKRKDRKMAINKIVGGKVSE